MPNAVLRFGEVGRKIDRTTGLDVIGFHSEEENHVLQMLADFTFEDEDPLGDGLLLALARGAGRRMTAARASDGYESLVERAYELFWLGAVSAAGAVGGVAFEQLMRAGLNEQGREWLAAVDASDRGPAKLNDIVGKVASAGGWDDARLVRYRRLRNDFAHRLGDAPAEPRNEGELLDEVDQFLAWLDKQSLGEDGVARLADVEPDAELTFQELLEAAQEAGEAAGRDARTTRITIAGERFAPVGQAWVVVRDVRRPFAGWLLEQGHARMGPRGAELFGPFSSFERNLEWAQAFAERLRKAGVLADYTGRAD